MSAFVIERSVPVSKFDYKRLLTTVNTVVLGLVYRRAPRRYLQIRGPRGQITRAEARGPERGNGEVSELRKFSHGSVTQLTWLGVGF